MKRILIGIATIAAVSAIGYAGTKAFFTDTETSNNNSFTTGTIDIAVDGNNPMKSVPYTLTDMKPSQVGYINFVVENVGTNPVNLYKTLQNFVTTEDKQSESKCDAIGGQWNNPDRPGCTGGTLPTDMEKKVRYDLRVELYQSKPDTNSKPYWFETIYQDSDNIRLDALPKPMYLGMIPVGNFMKVIQSYHMDSDTGNEYQGEKITFDIILNATQLEGSLRLENKYLADTDVSHTVWQTGGISDGKDATLTYGVKDDAFKYTLAVEGMTDGPYTLVSWEDPSLTWTFGPPPVGTTTVLANIPVVGGVANATGSIDLNKDIVNAKVWLVPGTLGVPGTTGVSLPWSATNTLFETGLFDYYDSVK